MPNNLLNIPNRSKTHCDAKKASFDAVFVQNFQKFPPTVCTFLSDVIKSCATTAISLTARAALATPRKAPPREGRRRTIAVMALLAARGGPGGEVEVPLRAQSAPFGGGAKNRKHPCQDYI